MRCQVFGRPAVGWAGAVALLAGMALAARAQTLPEGRFGRALDAAAPMIITGRAEYSRRPLTVECWTKLAGHLPGVYNILLANQTKASPEHWEIFTAADNGTLAAYLPGCQPALVASPAKLTDGQWHYIALLAEATRVRLFVDGKAVADVAVTRSVHPGGTPEPLALGTLVERGLGCRGLIDEVRLSKVVRDVSRVPAAPFVADDQTVGLWHCDARQDGVLADASPLNNPARRPVAPRPAPSLVRLPPEPDLAQTRQRLAAALALMPLATLDKELDLRDGLLRDWEEQYFQLNEQLLGRAALPPNAAGQVFDRQTLVDPADGDPLGVLLRRTAALLHSLQALPGAPALDPTTQDLQRLVVVAGQTPLANGAARQGLYLAACAVQRRLALANPLLDFDQILFVAHGVAGGARKTGPRGTNDAMGQHFATQYFGFNALPGGGLYVVRDFKTRPQVRNVLQESRVQRGRLQGQRLEPGAFLSPELSYDGQSILFAYTQSQEHIWEWRPETAYHLFQVNVDGTGLAQLTDGPDDDFDPCLLPDGQVVFISERRGGYIRCFSGLPVRQHVLHAMNPDGSAVHPISYFETSEWHPSVNNDGLLVYTRWDYTDRENCLGSNIWLCYPDGRDPRAPHGNYPYPWHTFPDNTYGDSRQGRPYTEMNIRAIPGSPRYIATAAPHHGESYGSLVMLDLRGHDDGAMGQIRRLTPYEPFPETETPARSQYAFGTPWPLSEDFYLCNLWENLYLLDRFGNRVLLCENALAGRGPADDNFRLISPIPLRPRHRPPVIPAPTPDGPNGQLPRACISITNVYQSDQPFPPGTTIKWLRVTQNILKSNPEMGVPMIGYQNENTPRIALGIVPVEADGSVYFEAPVERELIFQVLDANFMAVQSMRSVAYVHRGEHLSCVGCHEDRHALPPVKGVPLAARRAPSRLEPEVGPVEPITYYRLVQGVFAQACVPCHRQENKGPTDMSYQKLEPYVFYFAGGMSGTTGKPLHGGSRTIPGRFGARYSKMGQALLDPAHQGKISAADYRRVVLWLDNNSLRLGAYDNEDKQMAGTLVWPALDVDPANPQGLERRGK